MFRILLIEDDRTLRRALALTLSKKGYDVTEAENGDEGLRAAREQRVDLVITDLIMPGKEGLETIRELRRHSPLVPIIAITGGGRGAATNYLQMAAQFGAAKVFEKPFDFSALCEAVGTLLETASETP